MKKTMDWGSTLAILLLATPMNEGYLKKIWGAMVKNLKISSRYVNTCKIFCDLWPMTQASQTLVP